MTLYVAVGIDFATSNELTCLNDHVGGRIPCQMLLFQINRPILGGSKHCHITARGPRFDLFVDPKDLQVR